MVYALVGSNTTNTVVDTQNIGRNYGYVDFEKQKTRLIYLNTTDINGIDYTSHSISDVQIEWLKGIALDLSNKEDEQNWGVIICAHIPLFDNTVVANILGPLLIRFADEICPVAKKNLVISGILDTLYEEVLSEYVKRGFKEVSRKTIGEWTTGLLVRAIASDAN
jgi:hypothetical protein